jgi:hypothetical protein
MAMLAFCSFVALLILCMIGMAQFAALVKFWPYNLELTLGYYDFDLAEGGGWTSYFNSIRMSIYTAFASDQLYRETDICIDYCEDVAPLPLTSVDRIVALLDEAGATVKVASIHVNAWFGTYDKLSMTKQFAADCLGVDLDDAEDNFFYRGFAERRGDVRLLLQRCGRSQRTRF